MRGQKDIDRNVFHTHLTKTKEFKSAFAIRLEDNWGKKKKKKKRLTDATPLYTLNSFLRHWQTLIATSLTVPLLLSFFIFGAPFVASPVLVCVILDIYSYYSCEFHSCSSMPPTKSGRKFSNFPWHRCLCESKFWRVFYNAVLIPEICFVSETAFIILD